MNMFIFCVLALLPLSARCLVCYQCGVPGTMSCEEAFKYGLVLVEECPFESCVATSFSLGPGRRVMMKSCNRAGAAMCSSAQSRDMAYDTCTTCHTNFCNGPLPTCLQQLKHVTRCVGAHQAVTWVVAWCVVVLILALLGLAAVKYRQDRRDRVRAPLIAKYSSSRDLLLASSPRHSRV